jgi:Calx-beta domain
MTRRIVLLALLVSAATLVAVPAQACAGDFPTIRLGGTLGEPTSRAYYPVSEASSSITFQVVASGGCGDGNMSAQYSTSGGSATPGPGGDYDPTSGPANFFGVQSDPVPQNHSVSLNPDTNEEAIVESTNIVLSNPVGTSLALPSTAGILIVDDEGDTPRIGFEGIPHSQSETFTTAQIPVFRAGNASSASGPIGFTLSPGPGNPATPGEDVTPASGSASFGPGQRWTTIDLSIQNDQLGEGSEEFTVSLSGAGVSSPSSMTFTILDNEETEFPSSRLHHPRHKWRYKKSDYRIREVHAFTSDTGGSFVVGAQFALRRNLKSGDCIWLTEAGWQKMECSNRQWVDMTEEPGVLWYYRLKQLKSSVGTAIKDYTAFSRAIDGAGNVEKDFAEKRNLNTFEVRRSKPKR